MQAVPCPPGDIELSEQSGDAKYLSFQLTSESWRYPFVIRDVEIELLSGDF